MGFNYFIAVTTLTLLPFFSFAAPAAPERNPDRYNYLIWDGSNQSWFEWWYLKVTPTPLQETDPKEAFFLTLGMVNPGAPSFSPGHATIMAGDFETKILEEEDHPLTSFSAKSTTLDVKVGDSFLKGNHVSGQVKNIRFDFTIEKKWSFNAMGLALFVPHLTNIGWFPAQADASCTGQYEVQKPSGELKTVTFDHAPCYQDRNWGTSFPKWWTWLVSNHFSEDPTATLAVGGGFPKVLGHEILQGVTIGLNYQGHVYTFRPEDFTKETTDVCFGKWHVVAESLTNKIEIDAYAPPSEFMDLSFPTPQGEVFHDLETLSGSMTVKLYSRATPVLDFSLTTTLTTDLAGIEYGSPEAMESAMARCSKNSPIDSIVSN